MHQDGNWSQVGSFTIDYGGNRLFRTERMAVESFIVERGSSIIH